MEGTYHGRFIGIFENLGILAFHNKSSSFVAPAIRGRICLLRGIAVIVIVVCYIHTALVTRISIVTSPCAR